MAGPLVLAKLLRKQEWAITLSLMDETPKDNEGMLRGKRGQIKLRVKRERAVVTGGVHIHYQPKSGVRTTRATLSGSGDIEKRP
jgi:hypothetical protein